MANVRDIKQLYKMFESTGIGEVEIRTEDSKVRFSIGENTNTPSTKNEKPAQASEPIALKATASASKTSKNSGLAANVFEQRSTWVGFFTRLNPKTGEYYIKLRDEVEEGSVIAHVRVLGLFQDVKAEKSGKVKEILIEEGQPIEYGQPILRFEV